MNANAISRIPRPDLDPFDMYLNMDDEVEFDEFGEEDGLPRPEHVRNAHELEDEDVIGFFIDKHLEKLASLRNLMISGVSAPSIHRSLSSLSLTSLWIFDFAEGHLQLFTSLRHLRVTATVAKARADFVFERLPNLQTFSSSDRSKVNWIKAYGTWDLNLVPLLGLTLSEQEFRANLVVRYCSNQATGLRIYTRNSVRLDLDLLFWFDDRSGHKLAKCLDTLDLGFEIDDDYRRKLLSAIPSLRVIRTWKEIGNNGRDAWQMVYQRSGSDRIFSRTICASYFISFY